MDASANSDQRSVTQTAGSHLRHLDETGVTVMEELLAGSGMVGVTGKPPGRGRAVVRAIARTTIKIPASL